MASGIQFWYHPEEESEFLDYLETTGNIVAVPGAWVSAIEDFAPRPVKAFVHQLDPEVLLIGPHTYATNVRIVPKELDGRQLLSLDYMQPSMIHYRRPRWASPIQLRYGLLSVRWKYLDETGTRLIDKEPDFRKWVEKVFRWLRKWTPEYHERKEYRVTKRIKADIEANAICIVW